MNAALRCSVVLPLAACSAFAQAPARQLPIVARFDSSLVRAMGQPPKFTVELYRRTVMETLRDFVPEGDTLKAKLLSSLSAIGDKDLNLGMTAGALISFHDPSTVGPLLDRASRDSVSPFVATPLFGAAAAVLSDGDFPDINPKDPRGRELLAGLRAFADSAAGSNVGHLYAWRLRRFYDAEHAKVPRNVDYCEAMGDVSLSLVGTLQLEDFDVLAPMMDTSGSCAIGTILAALSYASNQDFLVRVRSMDTAVATLGRAKAWWRGYAHDHPNGDWRPAARAGLQRRGYALTEDLRAPASTRAFLAALSDTGHVTLFAVFRLLNDTYDTHADLDRIFSFGFYGGGMSFFAPIDATADADSLRSYWRRRLATPTSR